MKVRKEERYSLDHLREGIGTVFNQLMKINVKDLNLNRADSLEYEQNKKYLRQALRTCCYGDVEAKRYVKEYMKDLLENQFGIGPETIGMALPFGEPSRLTAADKFDILLHCYRKQYGAGGLERFLVDNGLFVGKESENGIRYEVTAMDVERLYHSHREIVDRMDFSDRLEIVTQRIYQCYRGHGVIDEIRDMKVDGVSGGVSGIRPYESVWIFFQGKTIHLSFLSFGTQQELERVCKNIYRYGSPGQLSAARGYIVNEMADGSRVIVVRPPFAESWAFFIRKFDSIRKAKVEELITDENYALAIETMKWLMKGCQVIGITGSQGSGKTTLLMSLVQYINESYTLRIQELTFELNLRKLYPDRNIVSFRETPNVSGQEGLDLQKKTDGTVNILGEVATAPVASWLIQIGQVASLFTVFTHHAKTTRDLVISLRNALLSSGGFSNERVAEEQVADTIRFDIHMNRDVYGHRYIERITEIISEPLGERMFRTADILVWEDGAYYRKNPISPEIACRMMGCMRAEEKREFEIFNQI